jgi:hypothetical protein
MQVVVEDPKPAADQSFFHCCVNRAIAQPCSAAIATIAINHKRVFPTLDLLPCPFEQNNAPIT